MKKFLLAFIFCGVLFSLSGGVKAACDPPECEDSAKCEIGCPSGYTCTCSTGKCCVETPNTCTPVATTCGSCDASCGGGSRSCTDGCSIWSENCNMQPCCNCTWTDRRCGDTLNGCGYEQMQQMASLCTPVGCGDSRCISNLACPWPAAVTGSKVMMPGNTMGVSGVADQPVTVDFATSTNNPYSIAISDTSPNTLRTASVPLNASYNIGYTLCYNDTTCHLGPIIPGNTVTIEDNSIRANGNNYANPYASLYWHYCPVLSTVRNLSPSGNACLASGSPGSITLSWSPPADGTATSYVVGLLDRTTMTRVIDGLVVTGLSTSATVVLGRQYRLFVTPRNECLVDGPVVVSDFIVDGLPTSPGTLSGRDIGGGVQLDWTNSTNGQYFEVIMDSSVALAPTVAPTTRTFQSSFCGTHSFRVDAVDMRKTASCRRNPSNTVVLVCDLNNSSWWTASGGGNLVSANGQLGSKVPASSYNPYLTLNADGMFPGIVIGSSFRDVDASNVNSRSWIQSISSPGWGSSGSNVISERENSYDGLKDRVWSRTTPTDISTYASISSVNIGAIYSLVTSTIGTTGIKIAYWNGGGTLNVGPLDLSGRKLIIFSESDVRLVGNGGSPNSRSVWWNSANPGFLTIIARGNISVDPGVGLVGLTMDKDVRWPPDASVPANAALYTPPHLQGIFYAGGAFLTPSSPDPVTNRDKIIKIDGSVIGMSGVNLGRVNVGKYPVEYVNFQPGLVTQLSQVGLRRKVVRELLNP